PLIISLSLHDALPIWQNAHNPMRQKAFSGTAGAHDRHHLSLTDFHIKISYDRKFRLMHSAVILGKTNAHIFYFQYRLFFIPCLRSEEHTSELQSRSDL